MDATPELELLHGDLCEIASQLERVNKNLETLAYMIETLISILSRYGR